MFLVYCKLPAYKYWKAVGEDGLSTNLRNAKYWPTLVEALHKAERLQYINPLAKFEIRRDRNTKRKKIQPRRFLKDNE